MLIIGHRGAAGLETENTISSFQKAQEAGVDMIETDLRLQNGKIVLSHDKPKADSTYVTLEELLQMAKVPLNLEIKETGFEEEVLKVIQGFAYKVVISSWNPWVLKKIRTLDGNIELGPVLGRKYEIFLPIVVSLLKNINISWITLDVALVDKKTIDTIKKVGWKVYAFTNDDAKIFNDSKEFLRLKDLGVEGIFTDYPDIVSKLNLYEDSSL